MAVEIKNYTIKYENGKHWILVHHEDRIFYEISDRDPNQYKDLKNYMLKSIECQILKYSISNLNVNTDADREIDRYEEERQREKEVEVEKETINE